jgi:pyridoxal 5'-phosphate synthase pdxT subunit
MKLGVLAIQGDFREHAQMLRSLGAEVAEVRTPGELAGLAGLIVPGGESTTIGMLCREYGLEDAVKSRVETGSLAVWGTCAGAIWLAKEVTRYPNQPRLGLLDITVERNAYGRQVDSFEHDLTITGLKDPFRAFFIRAPLITEAGPSVQVLAKHQNQIVLVQKDRLMASTFHPELTHDSRLHQYFIELASQN